MKADTVNREEDFDTYERIYSLSKKKREGVTEFACGPKASTILREIWTEDDIEYVHSVEMKIIKSPKIKYQIVEDEENIYITYCWPEFFHGVMTNEDQEGE